MQRASSPSRRSWLEIHDSGRQGWVGRDCAPYLGVTSQSDLKNIQEESPRRRRIPSLARLARFARASLPCLMHHLEVSHWKPVRITFWILPFIQRLVAKQTAKVKES
jgi:hypothetical protein